MTAVDTLATFVADLRWEAVDAAVAAQLKTHVLDTLGVICSGVDAEPARALRTAVERWGGAAEATVIGTHLQAPAPQAALANTFAGRIHTFDDTFERGPLHPGTTAVGAALAAAQAHGARGVDFLTGALVGYEVATRVSLALGPSHYGEGFHNTGTCNAFGAAAAAARAARSDATSTADVIALTGESAAGFRQYQADGSMTDSAMNAARAAQAALSALELQREGLTGPHGILDGIYGVLSLMSDTPEPARLTDGLGSHFVFLQTALKPYPSCRFTHGPLDALLAMRREHGFTAADVGAVEIATFRESIAVCDKPQVRTRTDAILSHQYATARALLSGDVTLADLDPERVAQDGIAPLMERVSIVHDAGLEALYPDAWPHRLTVRLRDGKVLTAYSERPPGGATSRLGWERVVEKFRSLAAPVVGMERALAIITQVESLEEALRLDEFARLLTPP